MDDDGGDRWCGRKENEKNSYLTSIGSQVNNDGNGASELVSLLVGEVVARKKKRVIKEEGFQIFLPISSLGLALVLIQVASTHQRVYECTYLYNG
ncbi:hypothetical protein QVD17_28703 [Tagetes erecta]|uniref:Transmembrane protein n=1 Tax=Tagetes erecta TaxID=13708 RepID=A0AAD8KB16_TARER|nr:hypothetical protein QVD17_28703 [Tagetes erecta]